MHLMVNDPLSAIVPIVAVNQLPTTSIVFDKGGTLKLLATPARNSQSTTVRLFLLFLYCIDSVFILFVRSIAQHGEHGFFPRL